MSRLVIAGMVLVGLSAFGQQSNLEEARTRFKRGAELYEENNYRAALVEFQRAYELSSNYKLLYNLGQVQMQVQDYASALASFSRYLTEGGVDLAPARREEVGKEVERLKGRVGRLTIETAPGAEVLVDDVSLGFAPLPAAPVVNTGRHKVTVIAPGRSPVSRVIDVAGQQNVTVVLGNEAPAPAVVVTQPAAPKETKVRTSAILLWVGTGVLAIGAGVCGALALSSADQLSQLKLSFGVTRPQLDAQASRVAILSGVSDGLTLGALVAGGLALFLTLAPNPESPPPAVSWNIGLGGVSVSGRF